MSLESSHSFFSHFERMDSYIPFDLLRPQNFLIAFLVVFSFVCVRYFLMVGPAYFLFWKSNDKFPTLRRLHDQKLAPSQIRSEIKWSLISSLIFSLSGVLLGLLWQQGFSLIYLSFDTYAAWYMPLSFLILALVHEFYFYWTHREMHRPSLFRLVHKVHHDSVKTSPWASFSFHPLECLVHAAFLPIMICVIPLHPLVIIAYLLFMTITAISNHLGVELLNINFFKKHFISGEHHHLHHHKMKFNYGLYFCFCDRLFSTEYRENVKKDEKKILGPLGESL